MSECFKIVAAFNEHACSWSSTDPAKKAQGNWNHQSARTWNYQENQSAVKPVGKSASKKQRRNRRKQKRPEHDERSINLGKLRNEIFGRCFLFAGIFHHLKNFCDRWFTVFSFDSDFYRAVFADRAAQHFFAWFNHDHVADLDFFRRSFFYCISQLKPSMVGPDIKQRRNWGTRIFHGDVFEQFADFIKEHYKDGFRILLDRKSTDRRNRHQRILVKHFAAL